MKIIMSSEKEVVDLEGDMWTRPKGSSYVWEHFRQNKAKGVVRCCHCPKELKFLPGSSTTNCRRHLANKHSIQEPSKAATKEPSKDSSKEQPKIDDAFAA